MKFIQIYSHSKYMIPTFKRKNAFDLMRLIMASFVLLIHIPELGGYQSFLDLSKVTRGQTDIGEIGVLGFFCLSGYLITSSFDKTKSVIKFSLNRILRIFPGLWLCLLVVGFVISPLIYYKLNGNLSGFLFTGKGSALDYVLSNFSSKINLTSPIRVLDKLTASDGSMNKPLWTLFAELQCYLITLVLGFFGLFTNKKVFAAIYIIIYAFYAINILKQGYYGPTYITLGMNLFKKAHIAFLSGMLFYLFEDDFMVDNKILMLVVLFTLSLLKFGGYSLFAPLLMSFIFINLFSKFYFHLKYDISYGVYIYHFPLGHLLFVYCGSLNLHPVLFMLLLFGITIPVAFLSYYLIEKPFLNLKKYYPKFIPR